MTTQTQKRESYSCNPEVKVGDLPIREPYPLVFSAIRESDNNFRKYERFIKWPGGQK